MKAVSIKLPKILTNRKNTFPEDRIENIKEVVCSLRKVVVRLINMKDILKCLVQFICIYYRDGELNLTIFSASGVSADGWEIASELRTSN